MVSLSYFLFVFFCMFFLYVVLQFVYKLLQFVYRLVQFIHQKKNVQDLPLNHSTPAVFPRSCTYDVFLSFRGEDTRKTFVDYLYSALVDRQITTYKDDETLPRGESIGPSLFEAIEESMIAIVIFSKNYADSSWCLEELAYIMKCRDERGLIVMPVFYGVDPSEVRKQKGDFGKAFAKQEIENTIIAKSWKKALVDASKIGGWEPKNIANGHEAQVIKKIVDTVFDRLFSLDSDVNEDLVGMTTRLQDLESLLDIRSPSVRMVGIWGVGGSGKTTLAISAYMKMSHHFQGQCIVENVREESTKHGLKIIQENILSAVCKREVKVQSIEEGKIKIKSMLCRRKVLVLLDDVNTLDQLDALAGSHKWFGSGSRIIITTRDEHLLRTHKIDGVCHVRLLSKGEAIQLFKMHAYNEEEPVEDYETLSLSVVSYADGLPLALKVLGSFLYDKDKNEWISALEKLKEIPESKVMDILKISYNGLEPYQKELYLDIACFFRRSYTNDVVEILEACGYYPKIGIKVLIQKALIAIVDGRFEMHDLIQEMGHQIVRGDPPNNPKRHSRLWKHKEINDMAFHDETMEYDKIEAIKYEYDFDFSRFMNNVSRDPSDSSHLCKIVSNMKKLRLLIVNLDNVSDENAEGAKFLSNELRYIKWFYYPASPFPHSFQPTKLVILKLCRSMQKELWKGYKHLPHLKVLELLHMDRLLSTPDFNGLPRLQKLTLECCRKLEEIHPSLGNHTSLEYLNISDCYNLKMLPTITQMKNMLLELPELPTGLAILTADHCKSLTVLGDFNKNCTELCQVSLINGWSDMLLQSMLKGKAIENGSMRLQLEGVEIPKGFTPPLLRGSSCRLELPHNWCSDFSGFLVCAVFSDDSFVQHRIRISIKQASGMDYQGDVAWEESHGDKYTWVWYVPFGSLRHTAWWNQTYSVVSFNMENPVNIKFCSGFGVRLVNKNSRSGLTETSTYSSSHYAPKIKIHHESASALTISSSPYNSA